MLPNKHNKHIQSSMLNMNMWLKQSAPHSAVYTLAWCLIATQEYWIRCFIYSITLPSGAYWVFHFIVGLHKFSDQRVESQLMAQYVIHLLYFALMLTVWLNPASSHVLEEEEYDLCSDWRFVPSGAEWIPDLKFLPQQDQMSQSEKFDVIMRAALFWALLVFK